MITIHWYTDSATPKRSKMFRRGVEGKFSFARSCDSTVASMQKVRAPGSSVLTPLMRHRFGGAILATLVFLAAGLAEAAFDPMIPILSQELERNTTALKQTNGNPPVFYLQYEILHTTLNNLSMSYGALTQSDGWTQRSLTVDIRVGDPQLDNTHPLRSRSGWDDYGDSQGIVKIPLSDDQQTIDHLLWLTTDRAYKSAVARLTKIKADAAVKVAEEDSAPDFIAEPAHEFCEAMPELPYDGAGWTEKLRRWSVGFETYPEITNSMITLNVASSVRYFVNSEGSKIQTGARLYRLTIEAQTTADDGMNLELDEHLYSREEQKVATDAQVSEIIERLSQQLMALRRAPLVEPYIGPAILRGRAGGVFFHEIFGHRVEGHRQKSEFEGKTFAKKVGEKILPEFINVYDDPTLYTLNGEPLNGFYRFDNEGVPAQRVEVVAKGVLKNFLMSRSIVAGFERSNGHGRRSPGQSPISRQGNLIIESEKTVPQQQLREMLIAECKAQDKPYGLIFDDIQGGFTQTGRGSTQGFKVIPLIVWKVYRDGRPDELIRGVDIVGTPLTSFSKIIATADDPSVFNGFCGAESGFIPIAAVSPSILVSEIEVAKKAKGQDKPPLLPPPAPPSSEEVSHDIAP